MDLKTIDLDQAEKAVSSLVAVSNDQQQQEYQPQTLRSDNRTRENYLPMFPTIAFGLNNQLLLANVPGSSSFIFLVTSLFFISF